MPGTPKCPICHERLKVANSSVVTAVDEFKACETCFPVPPSITPTEVEKLSARVGLFRRCDSASSNAMELIERLLCSLQSAVRNEQPAGVVIEHMPNASYIPETQQFIHRHDYTCYPGGNIVPQCPYRRLGYSVLQSWVLQIPLRAQGTLLTVIRGCDLVPKYPLDSLERRLVGALRYHIMVPADPREVDFEPGAFFSSQVPQDFKFSALGHYPLHWVSHIMHAAEVIAYLHPDATAAKGFYRIYSACAHGLHVTLETREQMLLRLTEDRIEKGTVVS